MKNKTTVDADVRLDALLAKSPLEAPKDFSRRVFDAIACAEIDARLAEKPVAGTPDFSARVMRAISGESVPAKTNALAFPRKSGVSLRFVRRTAAGLAATVAVAFGIFSFTEKDLGARVDGVLSADPELAQLASVPANEDTLSFDEVVEFSKMLAVLNENPAETAEFFAYYEN